MKAVKLFAAILAVLMFACAMPQSLATNPDIDINMSVDIPSDILQLTTKNVLLVEASTGTVLYGNRENEKAYPASTTKIMTAIIAIEKGNLDDTVTLGSTVESNGSTMGLRAGEILTLRDLVYGMMLVSGNDAARAIAEHIAGTRAAFSEIMNEYAARLGMKNTHFVTPNGLDSTEHYTTAYDMSLVARYAMQNETFRNIVKSETYNIPATNKHKDGFALENTNRLIHTKENDGVSFKYDGATGIKTGDTEWAGRCLVAAAQRDGMELIAVLFGDMESSRLGDYRYKSAAKLFDFGFANFQMLSATDLGLNNTVTCAISDAAILQVTLNINTSNSFACVPKTQAEAIKANASLFLMRTVFDSADNTLKAPLTAGDVVGKVEFLYKDKVVLTLPISAAQNVEVVTASSTSSPGVKVEEVPPEERADNAWLFYVICVMLLALLAILIVALVKRKAYRPRRARVRRRRRSIRGRY